MTVRINTPEERGEATKRSWKVRLKKVGMIGFLLFLLKGIAWLVIGYLVVSQATD